MLTSATRRPVDSGRRPGLGLPFDQRLRLRDIAKRADPRGRYAGPHRADQLIQAEPYLERFRNRWLVPKMSQRIGQSHRAARLPEDRLRDVGALPHRGHFRINCRGLDHDEEPSGLEIVNPIRQLGDDDAVSGHTGTRSRSYPEKFDGRLWSLRNDDGFGHHATAVECDGDQDQGAAHIRLIDLNLQLGGPRAYRLTGTFAFNSSNQFRTECWRLRSREAPEIQRFTTSGCSSSRGTGRRRFSQPSGDLESLTTDRLVRDFNFATSSSRGSVCSGRFDRIRHRPQAQRVVLAGRRDPASVGRDGHSIHGSLVPHEKMGGVTGDAPDSDPAESSAATISAESAAGGGV